MLLVVSPPASAESTSHHERYDIDNWVPNFDQPVGQLEEVLAVTKQQQPMNYTISNIYFLYDAKLYTLFCRLLHEFKGARRQEAILRQQDWLEKRSREEEGAYQRYQGGTLAPFNAAQVGIALTKQRIN